MKKILLFFSLILITAFASAQQTVKLECFTGNIVVKGRTIKKSGLKMTEGGIEKHIQAPAVLVQVFNDVVTIIDNAGEKFFLYLSKSVDENNIAFANEMAMYDYVNTCLCAVINLTPSVNSNTQTKNFTVANDTLYYETWDVVANAILTTHFVPLGVVDYNFPVVANYTSGDTTFFVDCKAKGGFLFCDTTFDTRNDVIDYNLWPVKSELESFDKFLLIDSTVTFNTVKNQIADSLQQRKFEGGNIVKFDRHKIYGTESAPLSGGIFIDMSNVRAGVIQHLFHQSNSAPNFTPMAGLFSGMYVPNQVNFLRIEYITSTRYHVYINQ